MSDDTLVNQAISRADATDLLSTKGLSFDSALGTTFNSGVDLSGGQWQKLALARSMMRQAPLVLLLDEPTSALDAHAEDLLVTRYSEMAQQGASRNGCITVLVSHRFSSVRFADFIVVLHEGKISEVGTHDELIHAHGHYATLFGAQAALYH